MTLQLKNKVALVTGGSAGLGAAVASQLAAEGVHVAINYNHSEERATNLAQHLSSKFGIKTITLRGDMFDKSVGSELVDETVRRLGGLDIVISNAGWTKIVPYDDLDALDDELWDGCFNVNVKAHFFLFKAAKKIFDTNKDGGTFIVSASVAGRIVYGSSIPYAVSKAALIHLVRMLAKTQGPKVRTHAVCPCLLLTEWGQRFSPERIEQTKQISPINSLADVEETAAQFVLLSKLTTSTGSIVSMDGGISI